MPPERTDLVLSTDVPHIELDVLVGESLDVEPDGWDGGHRLVEFQLVENGRLARSIEAEHQDAHFFGTEELAEEARNGQ